MESRLLEAARWGNVESLHGLLREDSAILERCLSLGSPDNPLHLSCLMGHLEFTEQYLMKLHAPTSTVQVLSQKNQNGYTPLHLASANGHVDVVKFLLAYKKFLSLPEDKNLCMIKGTDGKTALHCAMISGKTDVVSLLLDDFPEAAFHVTDYDETVLHLAVKHNQLEAFVFFIQTVQSPELLNQGDREGNTVLHLATAKREFQVIKRLVEHQGLDVNAENKCGLTALDIIYICPINSNDVYIEDLIRSAGGNRSQTRNVPNINNGVAQNLVIEPTIQRTTTTQIQRKTSKIAGQFKEMRNGVLIMASVIATVTFQVASNPPGGFWQDWGPNTNTNNNTTNITTITNSSNLNVSQHIPGQAVLFDLVDANSDKKFYLLSFLNANTFICSVLTMVTVLYPDLVAFAIINTLLLLLFFISEFFIILQVVTDNKFVNKPGFNLLWYWVVVSILAWFAGSIEWIWKWLNGFLQE